MPLAAKLSSAWASLRAEQPGVLDGPLAAPAAALGLNVARGEFYSPFQHALTVAREEQAYREVDTRFQARCRRAHSRGWNGSRRTRFRGRWWSLPPRRHTVMLAVDATFSASLSPRGSSSPLSLSLPGAVFVRSRITARRNDSACTIVHSRLIDAHGHRLAYGTKVPDDLHAVGRHLVRAVNGGALVGHKRATVAVDPEFSRSGSTLPPQRFRSGSAAALRPSAILRRSSSAIIAPDETPAVTAFRSPDSGKLQCTTARSDPRAFSRFESPINRPVRASRSSPTRRPDPPFSHSSAPVVSR